MSDFRLRAQFRGRCAVCKGVILKGQWIVSAKITTKYYEYDLNWDHARSACTTSGERTPCRPCRWSMKSSIKTGKRVL
jgi:hypothetical protein